MPVGHVVLKIYVPWKSFHVPSQYLYKPCKAYVYCWKNKYMPSLKNHMTFRACNHKSLCALGQDLHARGMRARLNVEPCFSFTKMHLKISSAKRRPFSPGGYELIALTCLQLLPSMMTFPSVHYLLILVFGFQLYKNNITTHGCYYKHAMMYKPQVFTT